MTDVRPPGRCGDNAAAAEVIEKGEEKYFAGRKAEAERHNPRLEVDNSFALQEHPLLLHPDCRDAESASAHTDVSIVAATIPNLTPLFSIPSAGVRLPSQQLLQNCCKIS